LHLAVLEMIWQGVKNEFLIYNLPDVQLSQIGDLNPGMNIVNDADVFKNFAVVQVIIQQEGHNIDKWWGSNQFGKYGYFDFLTGITDRMPFTWVNSQINEFAAPSYNSGFRCFLFPNVYAQYIAYGRLLPPKIEFSGNISGFYPFD